MAHPAKPWVLAGSYVHSSLNTNRPLLHLLIAVLGVFAAFSMYPLVRSGLSGIIGSAPGAEPMPPRADFPSLMRIQTQIRGVLNLSKNAMQAGSMLNSGISAVKDLDHLVRYSYFSCKAKLSGKLQHLISTGEPANGALSKFYLGILQLANTFETLDADALVRVQDIKDSMLPDVASERALFIEYSHMSEEMRIGIRELLTLGQSVLSIFVDMETKLADITTLLINERNILSYEQKLEADKNKNVLSMLWEILYEPGPIIYEQNMQSLRNVTTLADDAKGIISCALTMLQTMEQGLEDSLRQQTDAGRTVEIPWKTQASSIREGKKKLSDAISRVNDQEPVNGEALRDWILQPKKLINLGRLLDLI